MADITTSLDSIAKSIDEVASALNDLGLGKNGGGSGSSRLGKKDNKLDQALKALGGNKGILGSIGNANKALGAWGAAAAALVTVAQATSKYTGELNRNMSALNGASTASNKLNNNLSLMGENFNRLLGTVGDAIPLLDKLAGGIADILSKAAEGWRILGEVFGTIDKRNADEQKAYDLAQKYGISQSALEKGSAGLFYAIAAGGIGSARSRQGKDTLLELGAAYANKRGLGTNDQTSLYTELASIVRSGGTSSLTGVNLDDDIMSGYSIEKYNVAFDMLGAEAQADLRVTAAVDQLNIAINQGNDALVDYQRNFKKLGERINDAKNSLYSFDEVINQNAKIYDADGVDWEALLGDGEGTKKTEVELKKPDTPLDVEPKVLGVDPEVLRVDAPDYIPVKAPSSIPVNVNVKINIPGLNNPPVGEPEREGETVDGTIPVTVSEPAGDIVPETVTSGVKFRTHEDEEREVTNRVVALNLAKETDIVPDNTDPYADRIKGEWGELGYLRDENDYILLRGLGYTSDEVKDFAVNGFTAEAFDRLETERSLDSWASALENVNSVGKWVALLPWLLAGGIAAPEAAALFGTSSVGNLAFGGSYASGGIISDEMLIRAGEGGNSEAVIPLDTQGGIDYLASALQEAGASGSTIVNVNLSGQLLEMNDYSVRRLGERLASIIDNETNRRGALNYGNQN